MLNEKKTGKMTKRNLTKHRSMKTRPPLLLNAERKYKYLWENGAAAMLMIGADEKVIDANNAFLEMSGYSWHEVVGKNALDFVVLEQREEAAAQIQAALTHGAASRFEVRFRAKDGSNRALLLPPKPLVLEEGGQRIILVIGVDITERAKYENRLQALHTHASQLSSAEEIDTIVSHTLDAMEFTLGFDHAYFLLIKNASLQIKGSRGRTVAFSAQPLDGRGVTVKAANTKTTLRIPDTRKEPAYVDPKGYDWTGPPTVLSELVVPVLIDAEAAAVLCVDSTRLGKFTDDDQRLLETLAIHLGSALERLRHEKALQESEEKYRAIVENSPNMIGIFQDGVLKYVNSTGILKLGWTFEELVSPSFDPIENVVSQKSRSLLKENVGKRLRGEDVAQYEISLTKKDGSEVPVLVRGAKIIYNQKPAIEFVFDDITERKRMEGELSRSSQFLGSVIENAYVWLNVLDSQQNVLVWNKAAETMSGYSREEVEGQSKIWECLYPDQEYRKQTMETVEDILQSRRTDVDTETRIKRKDGQTRIISWNERALTDQDGKAIGTIAIGHDITERKKIEEKLRQSEERYRSLFDRILDGVYLSTHEGRFVDVNPAHVKMFGYSSKQEMLDITDIKKELYFTPEERGSHILDTDQEQVKVYRMRRKDGSEIWVEDHGGYVHDEKGNIIYHEGILRDVTERKRLEEKLKQYSLHLEKLVDERTKKLQESEEKYRDLFEACPVSLWEEDFSAVKQFVDELRQKGVSDFGAYLANHPEDIAKCAALVKVLNMNKATLDFYDAKSVDEIIGGLSGVLTEKSNRAFVGELVALVQGKKYYEAEFENRTLRGETKHCDVICAVVPGYEQSLAKVLVCIVDLTPQKKLEAELVKTQRLAAIGETAATVGHDLRNPLQGIAGALHLLKQESLTAEERNEMLQVIEKSLQYSDAIIKDLLEYSAEIKLKQVEATPNSITRDAMEAIEVPQNVTVQDLSEDQPTLRVDLDRIRRVFINLIENAIDAMPQGGTLTISSRKSGGNVEIALTDTGSGISEKVMENLWKPFQTTKAKGLGLGLAICKRIVDAHGGTIYVKSKAGEDTTVTIRLPIKLDAVEVKQK